MLRNDITIQSINTYEHVHVTYKISSRQMGHTDTTKVTETMNLLPKGRESF